MSTSLNNILICHPDEEMAGATALFFKTNNYDCSHVSDGKNCQKEIYQNQYDIVVLDFDTRDNHALEVLKYTQLNYPELKILMSFESKKVLASCDLTVDSLLKMGVSLCYFGVLEEKKLIKTVEQMFDAIQYDQIEITNSSKESVDIKAKDSDFSRVALKNLFQGKIVIFDYYARRSEGCYTKIFHAGEHFDLEKIKEDEIEFLYFKVTDRSKYISHMNKVLSKIIKTNKVSTVEKVATTKTLIEKYVEEVYVSGIATPLYQEALLVCESVFEFIKKEKGLSVLLNELEDKDPTRLSHIFLVSLLCATTCNNLTWATPRTMKIVIMGAMLHEIGKMKLAPRLAAINWVDDLKGDDLKAYRLYPKYGTEMLQQFSSVTEPVRQIVFQHQEYVNGEGFPSGLSGLRMYPPAKVVSLVNFFVRLMRKNNLTPKETLAFFITKPKLYSRFDAEVIKALIQSYVRQKL